MSDPTVRIKATKALHLELLSARLALKRTKKNDALSRECPNLDELILKFYNALGSTVFPPHDA